MRGMRHCVRWCGQESLSEEGTYGQRPEGLRVKYSRLREQQVQRSRDRSPQGP